MTSAKQRIMIVDDSITAREAARLMLEDAGYEVTAVKEPTDVPRLAAAEQPDLLLLDVMMPGVDGGKTSEMVRQEISHAGPNVRMPSILFYSGKDAAELEVLARQAGVDGYIRKTGDQDELVEQVRQWLERRSAP